MYVITLHFLKVQTSPVWRRQWADAHGCFFFPRKTSNRRSNAVLELKEHARKAINADDETVVSFSERDCGDPGCGDPGCGGGRTIVLIIHPRRPTQAPKIHHPLYPNPQTAPSH